MGSAMRFEISVDGDGVMFLPADVQKRMGLQNGGTLLLTESEFGLELTNFPTLESSTDLVE